MKDNLIKTKTFQFSLSIINLYRLLQQHKEFVISKQLLRSGTSIGANVEEAVAAESRADFTHKMSIASKEARETLYWLRLLHESKLIMNINYQPYIEEVQQIINITTKIVKTAGKN